MANPATTLLITGLGRGGAEAQLVSLARHLKSCGWDPEVVSLLPPTRHSAETRRSLAELREAEIAVWSPGIAHRGAALRGLWALARRWRARRPDLLCTFMFHANVVGRILGRLARVPVVVSSVRNERFGPRWRERLEAMTERLCDVTVVNSAAVAASLAARGVVQPVRCCVIPNGVDLARFAPQETAVRASMRRELGIPPDAFLWLAVGRLYPHKDHATLLRALRLVRARHPELRFECFGRFAGAGALPEGLTAHGYLDDDALLAFYRRCMVFVSPSYAEGWGLTAAEAMANGAAVIVAEDGGSRDFAFDGRTALVVPPRDPVSIAEAVSTLVDNTSLRSRIVAGGLARSREMSWGRLVTDFDRVLTARAA